MQMKRVRLGAPLTNKPDSSSDMEENLKTSLAPISPASSVGKKPKKSRLFIRPETNPNVYAGLKNPMRVA